MARTAKTEEVKGVAVKAKVQSSAKQAKNTGAYTLVRPRITEKASLLASSNVYTLNVPSEMNKIEIAKVVQKLYKVKAIKITVATIRKKNIFNRGKWGVKGGGKKAYVFLKKGDSIDFA
ncbi:MAG: 50S ribosomal protein L23 [Candidatus Paceibacterota bacterium]|jgi:large subunit ribosomal protein L23